MSDDKQNLANEILLDMVMQHIPENNGKYDSGFISTNADAIRFLADVGLMEITHDGGGRCVCAKIPSVISDTAKQDANALRESES